MRSLHTRPNKSDLCSCLGQERTAGLPLKPLRWFWSLRAGLISPQLPPAPAPWEPRGLKEPATPGRGAEKQGA